MTDHKLIYFCKQTGKEFRGKTLIPNELISLIDIETNEEKKVSKSFVTRHLKCSPDNRYKNKPAHCKPYRASKVKRTKEYYDWLNGDVAI